MTVGEDGRDTERDDDDDDAERPPARPPLRAANNCVVDDSITCVTGVSYTRLLLLIMVGGAAAYDGTGAMINTLERMVDATMNEPAMLRKTISVLVATAMGRCCCLIGCCDEDGGILVWNAVDTIA